MQPLLAKLQSLSTVSVNGVDYTGDSIHISNDGQTLHITGVRDTVLNISKLPELNIEIHGDVEQLKIGQGDLTCRDVTGDVKTGQGDVQCNNVTGDVKTGQGNIQATSVAGNAKTGMGNITCN